MILFQKKWEYYDRLFFLNFNFPQFSEIPHNKKKNLLAGHHPTSPNRQKKDAMVFIHSGPLESYIFGLYVVVAIGC
jgi:hypothetical protein